MPEGLGDVPDEIKNELDQNTHGEETPEEKEFELTPEIEEKIMEKVQDIDTSGLAYTSIDDDELSGILQSGILGRSWEKDEDSNLEMNPENWAKNARNKKAMPVFANIVGRSWESFKGEDEYGNKMPKPELGGSRYLRSGTNRLAILFNIESYKEETPGDREEKQKSGTYRADPSDLFDETTGFPGTEYGYHFAYRVPQRFFRGIVFQKMRDLTEEEKYSIAKKAKEERPDGQAYVNGRWQKYSKLNIEALMRSPRYAGAPVFGPIEEDNRETVMEYVSEIAKSELSVMKKPELFIPIYDLRGNLWWPKQMSYEEVKQFVAEREKKKEGEEKITSADDESASQ